MKPAFVQVFSPGRLQGRSALELLIAYEHTDVLCRLIDEGKFSRRDLRALMCTCKVLRDVVYAILRCVKMFLVPYTVYRSSDNIAVTSSWLTVTSPSTPDLGILKEEVTPFAFPQFANKRIAFSPPIKMDMADVNARTWWNQANSPLLLPLDIARAFKKEKKKRKFVALAREVGLLPSTPLSLPPEPWH
jgi:hypothetical protein